MPTTIKEAAPHRLTFATLSPVPRASFRAKRTVDLMLGIPIALLASPLLLLIWVTYKLSGLVFQEDRGPVFRQVYRHAHGRVIPIYKVRVSTVKALDAGLAKIADQKVTWLSRELGEDTRCLGNRALRCLVEDTDLDSTRFGSLVKAIYLDELPQIINVVKGDMSLVGPRPLPLGDWRCFPSAIPPPRQAAAYRKPIAGLVVGYAVAAFQTMLETWEAAAKFGRERFQKSQAIDIARLLGRRTRPDTPIVSAGPRPLRLWPAALPEQLVRPYPALHLGQTRQ